MCFNVLLTVQQHVLKVFNTLEKFSKKKNREHVKKFPPFKGGTFLRALTTLESVKD